MLNIMCQQCMSAEHLSRASSNGNGAKDVQFLPIQGEQLKTPEGKLLREDSGTTMRKATR